MDIILKYYDSSTKEGKLLLYLIQNSGFHIVSSYIYTVYIWLLL